MERYRSVGVATIAALMGTGRDRGAPSSAADRHGSGGGLAGGRDCGQTGRRCERAVVTAYQALRGHGTGDGPARQACTTLYRIHHPEASVGEARRLVGAWIEHHVVRAADGETPGCDCG